MRLVAQVGLLRVCAHIGLAVVRAVARGGDAAAIEVARWAAVCAAAVVEVRTLGSRLQTDGVSKYKGSVEQGAGVLQQSPVNMLRRSCAQVAPGFLQAALLHPRLAVVVVVIPVVMAIASAGRDEGACSILKQYCHGPD
jgi:hypothetical protein